MPNGKTAVTESELPSRRAELPVAATSGHLKRPLFNKAAKRSLSAAIQQFAVRALSDSRRKLFTRRSCSDQQ